METIKEKINRKRGEYTRARRKAYLRAKNAFIYSVNKQKRSSNNIPFNNNIIESDNTMTNTFYSYKRTLYKTLKLMFLIALGIGINQSYLDYPEIMGLTIGGAFVAMLDYLKHKWCIKF